MIIMLAGRQLFGVWCGFSCFFIWCQLFAWLIRADIFCLPPAFVVWSFFLCHRHLWSVLSFFATCICVRSLSFTAFSAIGICVRLFVFALLVLVSGYQCISQFLYHAVRLLLVSFILGIFSKSVTLWTALQILLWGKPHLVFHHKVYKISFGEVLATQMGVTEVLSRTVTRALGCCVISLETVQNGDMFYRLLGYLPWCFPVLWLAPSCSGSHTDGDCCGPGSQTGWKALWVLLSQCLCRLTDPCMSHFDVCSVCKGHCIIMMW